MRRFSAFAVLTLLALPAFTDESVPDLMQNLMNGNHRFVEGKLHVAKIAEQRGALSNQQHPPVTLLACSDSRVPPELVFDQSLGDLFVIREAGNVADTFSIASIEYAIASGYTKLVVVLGHERCGAVSAALADGDPQTPSLLELVTRIRSSFGGLQWKADDPAALQRAVEANARASAAWLVAHSRVIREAVRSGEVRIVAATYDLDTGEVRPLD